VKPSYLFLGNNDEVGQGTKGESLAREVENCLRTLQHDRPTAESAQASALHSSAWTSSLQALCGGEMRTGTQVQNEGQSPGGVEAAGPVGQDHLKRV
jgi:hypothetical protein